MNCRGFTIVELLIVAMLMSIIAATGIRLYSESVEDARVHQTIQSFRTVHRAAQALRLQVGKWPTGYGINFPEFDPFLGPSFLGGETAIGGTWYWVGGVFAGQEYAIIVIAFPQGTPVDTCQRIDELIDDGTPSTGNVYFTTTYMGYVIQHWQ